MSFPKWGEISMVNSCDSEESLLAFFALQFSSVRFSSWPWLRIPPVCLPVSSRSKPQHVCALVLKDWSHRACSGRGSLLGGVCSVGRQFVEFGRVEAHIATLGLMALTIFVLYIGQCGFLRLRLKAEHAMFSRLGKSSPCVWLVCPKSWRRFWEAPDRNTGEV